MAYIDIIFMNQSKKHIDMTILAQFYVAYERITIPSPSKIDQTIKILHHRTSKGLYIKKYSKVTNKRTNVNMSIKFQKTDNRQR